MKPEKNRYYLLNSDRDNVLRLLGCGLSTSEIANMLGISKSTVSYVRQAHNACITKDAEALRRLTTFVKPTVEWAMKVTGTDVSILDKPVPVEEAPATVEEAPVVDVPTNNDDIVAMRGLLSGIYNMLTEIHDMLK